MGRPKNSKNKKSNTRNKNKEENNSTEEAEPTTIDIEDEIQNTEETNPTEEENNSTEEAEEPKPKQKKHITRQTVEEFHKKADILIKFLEQPEIKTVYQLNWHPVGGDSINVYQGSRGNQKVLFKRGRYDKFFQTGIKKLFINRLGRFNLDLEEDYNK